MIKIINRLAIAALLIISPSYANDLSKVEMKVSKIAGNVYMLQGHGGNIGLLATDDGLLMIDNQFKPLAPKIEKAMQSVIQKPLKYIVNTHYHGDHLGGNEVFSKHAPIFAHHNVRQRLMKKETVNANALPVVTFKEGVSIFLADETIELKHLPSGHTDGDTFVYFVNANVIHTGDLFFNGLFPYIDLNGGGSLEGYLANVQYIISNYPKEAVIIPGHGPIATIDDYRKFAEMLAYSIDLGKKALAKNMSEAEFIRAGIGAQYEHLAWAFISEKKWLTTIYQSLSK